MPQYECDFNKATVLHLGIVETSHFRKNSLFSFPPIYSFTQKIIDGDFLKGSTCKELGSHHFSLITSQKLTTEKSTTLLRSIREEMTQVKSLPPRLEKWANTGSHSLLEPKLTSGSLCGRQCWVGKPELQFMNCWTFCVDKSEELKNFTGPSLWRAPTVL